MTDAVLSRPVTSLSGAPVIRLAPAGRHTRYMLAAYLRHVFIVTAGLLAIALTIDLWPQLPKIEASAGGSGPLMLLWAVLRFAGLRAPDLIIPFFPFATFLGVVWTEIVLTESRERLLVWNSGRAPVQCLMPVVVLGVILGPADFTMDAFLRPAFMNVQIHERLGTKGEEFDRTRVGDASWIALNRGHRGLLRAKVIGASPVTLRDVAIYRFDPDGLLIEVDMAPLATPLSNSDSWLLHHGRFWKAAPSTSNDGGVRFTVGTAPEAATPFAQKTVLLDVNRLWLSNRGISVQYLPLSVVGALAYAKGGSFRSDDFRTHFVVKFSELFLPGEMALLAACLSMLFFTYRTSTPAVVLTLLLGYLAHFANKAMLLMGSNSYANAYVAGWLVPVALVMIIVGVLRRIEEQRGLEPAWLQVPAFPAQDLRQSANDQPAAPDK